MGLTMSQRQAVTKTIAARYRRAGKAGKGRILDELCATTGWHRSHARKALAQAGRPRLVRERAPRTPKYGDDVVASLRLCWAVLGAPTGKRLAPVLPEVRVSALGTDVVVDGCLASGAELAWTRLIRLTAEAG